MKKVIISAGLLALGAVAVGDARAQSVSTTDKPWTVAGTLRGFYDDNYNTQPSGPAKNKSFGVEVVPHVEVAYKDGPNTLSAAYYYKMRYYFARSGHQPDQDHRFEISAQHKFNANDAIKVQDSFVDSQDPEVLNPGVTTGVLRANGDNYHNVFGIVYNQQINNLLGFVLGYNNNWYRYTGSPSGTSAATQPSYGTLLNRFEHNFTFDSRWTYTDLTTFVLGYQFGITAHTSGGNLFPGTPAYVPATSRDFYSHYIYVGVDHTFTEELKGTARVGVLATDFYHKNQGTGSIGGSSPDSTSPYVNLALTYDYMDGGSASLGFTDSQNSTDVSGTYNQITEAVNANVSQTLKFISPDLVGSLTGSFQNSDYNGGISGNDKTYSAGANLTYNFNKNFSTEIGYNYTKLTSSSNGRNYVRNYAYIGGTVSY